MPGQCGPVQALIYSYCLLARKLPHLDDMLIMQRIERALLSKAGSAVNFQVQGQSRQWRDCGGEEFGVWRRAVPEQPSPAQPGPATLP
jgi:hypothetical protein